MTDAGSIALPLALLLGLALGLAAGFALARLSAGAGRAALEARLEERDRALAEQGRLLESAEKRLSDAFRSLGSEALASNNAQFLDLARGAFETLLAQARGDGEQRRVAIEAMVKPIQDTLEKQARLLHDLETRREVAYQGVLDQAKAMVEASGKLVTALRRPEQRGRWGEMQLRNVVEMAGMTEHCDFVVQATVAAGTQRPDLVVRLPGGGTIVVDAKVALDAYLDALEPDCDRPALLQKHAAQVQRHWQGLAGKEYWKQFDRAPQLVVMFMPLESALVAALEARPDLHAEAMRQHVLIGTPTLLVALLRAVAYGWQQDALADNAREIAAAGRELYDRLGVFAEHLSRAGRGLEQALGSYNKAVGSLEAKVLPAARRLKDLHATTAADLEPPEMLPERVRESTRTELAGPGQYSSAT